MGRDQVIALCEEEGVCVVVPTYNNAGTVKGVVEGARQYCGCVIIVNDGSTDCTAEILGGIEGLILISYRNNKGKGYALRKGFDKARELGYTYAVTIDSDGQHDPADIPLLVYKLAAEGESLVIGTRNMEQPGIPAASNFGRKFSNFWFRLETGVKCTDTQSGFRLYPIVPLGKMRLFTNRFEFEIESIVRLAWRGIPVFDVPVGVKYMPSASRVSHFKPFRDFLRISILNTCLVFLALLWYRPLMLFRQIRKNGIRQILLSDDSPAKLSTSVGFGIFMGILPIWGFQLLTAIVLAFLFRLNKPLVIIFANISIPPFIPVILYLSMLCGIMWVPEGVDMIHFPSSIGIDSVKPFILQYISGSLTLAVAAGLTFGLITYLLLIFRKQVKEKVKI